MTMMENKNTKAHQLGALATNHFGTDNYGEMGI